MIIIIVIITSSYILGSYLTKAKEKEEVKEVEPMQGTPLFDIFDLQHFFDNVSQKREK